MPALTFDAVLKILLDHGFEFDRQKGSHRTYKGTVNGQTQVVTLAGHKGKEIVKPRTLASIIRQSGLPKKLFR